MSYSNIGTFGKCGVLAMGQEFSNFSTRQNMGQYVMWSQTQSRLCNSRDMVSIHSLEMPSLYPGIMCMASPVSQDKQRWALTPSLTLRAFLSLTLPKEEGKSVPNCHMTSPSVIHMARGIPKACQFISKVITLAYYTCLARFE